MISKINSYCPMISFGQHIDVNSISSNENYSDKVDIYTNNRESNLRDKPSFMNVIANKAMNLVDSSFKSLDNVLDLSKSTSNKTLLDPYDSPSALPEQSTQKEPGKIKYIVKGGLNELGNIALKIVFKQAEKQNSEFINEEYNDLQKTDKDSPEYIDHIIKIGKKLAQGMKVDSAEVNIEDGALSDIANSDESCIFIMNHDSPIQDAAALGIFNSLLYNEYNKENKSKDCPRPSIIVSNNVLDSQTPKIKAISEKIGCVGVDANIYHSKEGRNLNSKQLEPVIKDFCADKKHLFIFPEGQMNCFKNSSFKERFQAEVGSMVKIASLKKDRVKVVPVGFGYDKNDSGKTAVKIQIGEPVYFIKDGKKILANAGNIRLDNASENYKKFFYDDGDNQVQVKDQKDKYKDITNGRENLSSKEQAQYIAGALAENLNIIRDEAIK